MDDLVTARYTMAADDFVDFCVANQRHLWRSSPVLKLGKVVFFLFLAVLAAGWFVQRGPLALQPWVWLRDLTIPLLVIGLVVYLFRPSNLLNRLGFQYQFRSMVPEAARSTEWGFDGEGLWYRNALAESTFRWELCETIVESPRCFLFYQASRNIACLPSRGFSSPGMLRSFTDLARLRVPNYVVLGPCYFPAKPEPIGLDEL